MQSVPDLMQQPLPSEIPKDTSQTLGLFVVIDTLTDTNISGTQGLTLASSLL